MRHGPKGVDSVWRLIGVPGAAEVKYNVHGARAFVDVKSRFWQSDYGIVGHSAIDNNFCRVKGWISMYSNFLEGCAKTIQI